uniref:Uncharacterized protein n=1 Tax=Timema genevievae TaxID=629358 RepID=A0A7R9JZP4_TIMGE|nr:unnamed protein product [Timema genevievae]
MPRYLVGARDLQPGEVIMSEEPLVVGPCQGCKPMCLGCYKLLVSDTENMASHSRARSPSLAAP